MNAFTNTMKQILIIKAEYQLFVEIEVNQLTSTPNKHNVEKGQSHKSTKSHNGDNFKCPLTMSQGVFTCIT
jgi:hypothetical protein